MTSYYGSSENSHPHGGTPDHIIEKFVLKYGLLFDPCPNNPNFDGLEIQWPKDKVIFVNPPYTRGEISKWVEKCYNEFMNGCKIILLIPAYTDTIYFHEYIKENAKIEFIKGRLKFKGYENNSASFPSIFCFWGFE